MFGETTEPRPKDIKYITSFVIEFSAVLLANIN